MSPQFILVEGGATVPPILLVDPQTLPPTPGDYAVGHTIVCDGGLFFGATTITYAWYTINGLVGETSNTYTIQAGDIAFGAGMFECIVTASNSFGSISASGIYVQEVSWPYPTILPIISGTPAPGNTMSSTHGSFASNGNHSLSFLTSWCLDGLVGYPSGNTYSLTISDSGKYIYSETYVTFTSSGGFTQSQLLSRSSNYMLVS